MMLENITLGLCFPMTNSSACDKQNCSLFTVMKGCFFSQSGHRITVEVLCRYNNTPDLVRPIVAPSTAYRVSDPRNQYV
eukprot:3227667-Rhodomonas_salina.1